MPCSFCHLPTHPPSIPIHLNRSSPTCPILLYAMDMIFSAWPRYLFVLQPAAYLRLPSWPTPSFDRSSSWVMYCKTSLPVLIPQTKNTGLLHMAFSSPSATKLSSGLLEWFPILSFQPSLCPFRSRSSCFLSQTSAVYQDALPTLSRPYLIIPCRLKPSPPRLPFTYPTPTFPRSKSLS